MSGFKLCKDLAIVGNLFMRELSAPSNRRYQQEFLPIVV